MWTIDVPRKKVDQAKLGRKLRVVFGDEDYEVQGCALSRALPPFFSPSPLHAKKMALTLGRLHS